MTMKKTKKNYSITSTDEAISIIENEKNAFPVEAVEYLLNEDRDQRIIKKAHYHVSNFNNEKLYYYEKSKYGPYTPLCFLILADKHHDESLIEPCINLYTEPDSDDYDAIYDQGSLLLILLCRNYPDIAIPKIFDAIDKASDTDVEAPLTYLSTVFFYAHKGKYKKRILQILSKDEFYDYAALAFEAANLQIKEVIPILKNKLDKIKNKKFHEVNQGVYQTMADALLILETGELDFESPDDAYERLRDWRRWVRFLD